MVEDQRDSVGGLALGAAFLAQLFGLGVVATRSINFDGIFGVEGYRAAGVTVLLPAFGLLLAMLLVPGLAGGTVRVIGRTVGVIPAPIRLAGLLAAAATDFRKLAAEQAARWEPRGTNPAGSERPR